METKQSLSHETAKVSQLSIETNERFINLLNTLFSENKAQANDYVQAYWSVLQSSMCDENLEAHVRQNFVIDTQQNIETIHVLYSMFKELKIN
jgi:peroxiredoxin